MEAAMWRDMNMSMNGMEPSWTPVDALLMLAMWSAMMAAMMVPGASPMITAFATINRRRRERSAPYVPTAVFLLGYVMAWTGFSILATALHWFLQMIGLLTTMCNRRPATGPLPSSSPLASINSARSKRGASPTAAPPELYLSEWRDGNLGEVIMVLRYGLF